jgi:uncharacterized membrane protein YhaH (DUF805 family)
LFRTVPAYRQAHNRKRDRSGRPEVGSWTIIGPATFSFEGRINRAKYWYALYAGMISCLVRLVLLVFFVFALDAIFGASVKSVHFNIYDIFTDPPSLPFRVSFDGSGSAWLVSLLFYAAATPIFVGAIRLLAATTVKRFHDRNKSGWWIVPFFSAPILLSKVGDWLGDSYPADFLMLVRIALSLWGSVEILCLSGTRGPNRFGPDPQAPLNRSPRAALNWDQLRELEFVRRGAGPSPAPHVKRGHD